MQSAALKFWSKDLVKNFADAQKIVVAREFDPFKVLDYIDIARGEGATAVLGGGPADAAPSTPPVRSAHGRPAGHRTPCRPTTAD